jgi:hypothetical protein
MTTLLRKGPNLEGSFEDSHPAKLGCIGSVGEVPVMPLVAGGRISSYDLVVEGWFLMTRTVHKADGLVLKWESQLNAKKNPRCHHDHSCHPKQPL